METKFVLAERVINYNSIVSHSFRASDLLFLAVYDVTIAYKNSCPDLMDNVYGVDPSEVHIDIRRIPLKQIPVAEEEASAWLIDAFQRKDKLLTYFNTKGHFPNQRSEAELSTVKCLINCTLVIALTGIFTYVAFVSMWMRVYIALSCVYLASATYFNFRPLPLLDFVKSRLCRDKRKK